MFQYDLLMKIFSQIHMTLSLSLYLYMSSLLTLPTIVYYSQSLTSIMMRVSVRVGGEWIVVMCGDSIANVRQLGENAIARFNRVGGKFSVRRCADGAPLELDAPISKLLRNDDFVDIGNVVFIYCMNQIYPNTNNRLHNM